MSLTARLGAVKAILQEFFSSSGQEDNSEHMIADLRKAGAVNESFAAEMTIEDVLQAVSVPTPVARKIVKALGNDKTEAEKQIVVVCDDPVTMALRMSNRQLVEAFDPDEADSPVAQRLIQKVGTNPFIVWDDDHGKILIDSSVECLEDIIGNYPKRDSMVVDGVTRPVLPIGIRPNIYADENPVVPCEILRRDGTSAKNVEWGSIDIEIRKLLRVALADTKELVVPNEYQCWKEVTGKSLEEIGRMYPAAFLRYKELRSANTEPKLRIGLKQKGGTAAASGTK